MPQKPLSNCTLKTPITKKVAAKCLKHFFKPLYEISKKYIMCNCCQILLAFLLSCDRKPDEQYCLCCGKAPRIAGVSRAMLVVTNDPVLQPVHAVHYENYVKFYV